MALGDSYATVKELKDRMGITSSADDGRIAEALNAASRWVEDECGRQFNKTTSASARVYTVDETGLMHVDDFHTTTGLVVQTDDVGSGTFATTWATTDYELYPLGGVVGGESGWPFSEIRAVSTRLFPTTTGRGALQVTAQWGWPAVPSPVKEATLIFAEALFKLKDAPHGVAGFEAYGAVRVRENPYVNMLLRRYKRFGPKAG